MESYHPPLQVHVSSTLSKLHPILCCPPPPSVLVLVVSLQGCVCFCGAGWSVLVLVAPQRRGACFYGAGRRVLVPAAVLRCCVCVCVLWRCWLPRWARPTAHCGQGLSHLGA